MTLREKLEFIRKSMDVDVKDVDIDSVKNKGLELSQLIGLSAECKAEARRNMENARLAALKALDGKISPSVLLKMAEASCADQVAILEYADRINAGLVHQLDFLRSVISLHKEERKAEAQNSHFSS